MYDDEYADWPDRESDEGAMHEWLRKAQEERRHKVREEYNRWMRTMRKETGSYFFMEMIAVCQQGMDRLEIMYTRN